MSPRLIQDPDCPACGERLPEPKPRACPFCGKSQQQRFLTAGCLTSAPPPLILVALGAWYCTRWWLA